MYLITVHLSHHGYKKPLISGSAAFFLQGIQAFPHSQVTWVNRNGIEVSPLVI